MILLEEYEKRKDVLRAKFFYVESEYSEIVQNLLISTMTSELIDKFRFDRQSIMMICDMLQDDLESSTFRNRATVGQI
jgi:hypothetical protein